jgi:methionyl-tRNA formyltransferase
VSSAVVFGYGDIGIRCLATLLAADVAVRLVVTHEDDPRETRWFGSLAQFATERGIAVLIAESVPAATLAARVADASPDFIFSFYYRRMLPVDVLRLARTGALNMHGSLLPLFRGRAPINWAVLRGATQTGATLHYMTERPDAGNIVGQQAVPILPDDTALDVFRKVCAAAECLLHAQLPALLDGSSMATPQDTSTGSYYGGRRPEDGTIDWTQPAQRIHDLVRAVAPPYPGAFTRFAGVPARILRTLRAFDVPVAVAGANSFARDGRCYAACGDGRALRLLEVELAGAPMDPTVLAQRLATSPVRLGPGA